MKSKPAVPGRRSGTKTKVKSKSNLRATSYDVARLAGVSQSAVSRAFQPGASASAKLRERVRRAAVQLGYTPNAIARSLITRRSNLVAVLISNLTNLYYPEVLSELAAQAARHGLRILLFSVPNESDIDSCLDQVLQYQVDGVIAAVRLGPQQLESIEGRHIPVVFYNRYLRDRSVNAVVCDQSDGVRILIGRLHAAGLRHYGVIAGPEDSVVAEERLSATLATLLHLGIRNTKVVRGAYDYESGARGLQQLIEACGRVPEVAVCANDIMAIGCLDAARFRMGLNVPAQLSIVGFDGVGPSTWDSYKLTTVRQPVREMAQSVLELLISRIETPGMPPEKRMLPGLVVEGSSATLA